MNILMDEWLPVYLKDGNPTRIRPYEITKNLKENPAVRIAFDRPDLDATMVEFLIGVLQTFYCPDERVAGGDWTYIYSKPPDPETLRSAFEPFTTYFNLLGGGFRFMQDRSICGDKKMEEILHPGALLIDFDANQSHFSKRRIESLCLSCMSAVLYTLQVRANTGGRGHMQNIRSGNAFTTLVKGDTLWETCWLNVLGRSQVEKYGNALITNCTELFPWTKESVEGLTMRPEDASLLHCYWQMPRRVFLKSINHGTCMLCHKEDMCVTEVISSSKGIKYAGGNWYHPLSPVIEKTEDDKTVFKLVEHKEYGTRYKHWLALTRTEPAPCVAAATRRNQARKLWAFGYVCRSKLALAWDEGEFPVFLGDELERNDMQEAVKKMVDMATKGADLLQKCAGKAVALIAKGSKGKKFTDKAPFATRFWEASENDFYRHVNRLKDVFSGQTDLNAIITDWGKRVNKHAIDIFDGLTAVADFNSETIRIVAEHRVMLIVGLKSLYTTRKEGKRGKTQVSGK
ncbi:MAG: type I-E CRISPR-associated protein Cse1/CasA [Syntrophales bacterium]